MAYDPWGNYYEEGMDIPMGGGNPGGDPSVEYTPPPATAPPPPDLYPAGGNPNNPGSGLPDQINLPGGGKTPQQIEAEGRAFDAAHGYIGGYMSNGVWVNGSPRAGGGGGGGSDGGGGMGGAGSFTGWGNYGDAPQFTAPRFDAGPQFRFDRARPDAFVAPGERDMMNEPGYQFRLDQGRKALEQSAAGRGVLRTGGTLKDLVNYGQNFASGEYANVYNRRASEHDRGFREYLSDYDMAADTFSKNYGIRRDVFDRDYQGALAEYTPKFGAWQTNANIGANRELAQFNNAATQARWEAEMARQRERDRIEDVWRASQPRT